MSSNRSVGSSVLGKTGLSLWAFKMSKLVLKRCLSLKKQVLVICLFKQSFSTSSISALFKKKLFLKFIFILP